MNTTDLDQDKPATPDILWKELIKKRFRDFVAFYKPDLFPEVNFDKTEFLDKELLSITGEMHKGLVDVLAKVYLKKGGVEFVLFHIEVQGYREEEFPLRMFLYFIRIWDKYHKPVIALAVITPGLGKAKVGNSFGFEVFGTKLHYEYNLFDIRTIDYNESINSTNPVQVAAAILAPCKDVPPWKKKFDVIRRLVKMGLTSEERHLLVSYVDRHLKLEGKQLDAFESHAAKEKKEVGMIMTSFEEKGIKKGIEQNQHQITAKMIQNGMSNADIRKITGLSMRKIEEIGKKLRT